MNRDDFRTGLERLINRYSMENGSETPDFILAKYLVDCLAAFDHANKVREAWYGRDRKPVTAPSNSLCTPVE